MTSGKEVMFSPKSTEQISIKLGSRMGLGSEYTQDFSFSLSSTLRDRAYFFLLHFTVILP